VEKLFKVNICIATYSQRRLHNVGIETYGQQNVKTHPNTIQEMIYNMLRNA
jgi:hypothetical protein